MPLFEVAILEKPTKNEAEDGKGDKLVFGPKAVVARDVWAVRSHQRRARRLH